MRVGIDLGHCLFGYDTGAVGVERETDLNREVGKYLFNKFGNRGIQTVDCTVDTANSVNDSLNKRVRKANAQKLDLFISLHFNAGGGTGTEAYIFNGNYNNKESNRSKAKAIVDNISNKCNLRNRGVKEANFYVLAETVAEAVLIEVCFVDNQNDLEKLRCEEVAEAIVQAIAGKVEEKPTTPQPAPTDRYLNLHPHVTSWRVYPMNKPPVVGNECAKLSPSQYGGLSYKILEDRGNVKVIQTQMFGKVQIFAPTDSDSIITLKPIY